MTEQEMILKAPGVSTIEFDNGIKFSLATMHQDKAHALLVCNGNESSVLSASDALDLLDWLYQQRSELYELAHAPTDEQIRAILAQPPLDDSGFDELTF